MAEQTPFPPIIPNSVILGTLSAAVVMLDILPMVWHAKHHNMAATSLIFWVVLLNSFNLINAIIWPGGTSTSEYQGQGLCDVQVKLVVASWAGLPCALASITRSLARVMDPEKMTLSLTTSQKRRQLAIDLLTVWTCPIGLMAVHYVVQSNRYYLRAVTGCNPSFDNSWPTFVLIFMWPCIFALIDAYYAVLLIIRLHRYRAQFHKILQANNTTRSRFLRLTLISGTLILGLVPLSFWVFASNLYTPLHPYSWAGVHNPATWPVILPLLDNGTVLYDRWINIAAGILVFAFFGTGHDALIMYKRWLRKAGFGRVFPALCRDAPSSRGSLPSHSSTTWSSIVSRKGRCLLFGRRSRRNADTAPALSSRNSSITAPPSETSTAGSFTRIPRFSWHSSKSQRAHAPYDGLPKAAITAEAHSVPGSRRMTTDSNRDNILITRELWMETEGIGPNGAASNADAGRGKSLGFEC